MLSEVALQTTSERRTEVMRAVWQVLLVGMGYYLGAKVGLALTLPRAPSSAIWLPNAILLAALLLTPARRWWISLLGGLLGHFAAQLEVEPPLWVAVRYVNNLAQVLLAAALVRRFADAPHCFDRLRKVVLYIVLAVVLAPALVALQAAGIFVLGGRASSFWLAWRGRFLSNMLATLTITPAILLIFKHGLGWVRNTSWQRYAEAVLLVSGLLLVGQMVYGGVDPGQGNLATLLYTPLPLLLWAAVRFGPEGAYASILLIALLSIRHAINGHGPFVTQSPSENVLSLQVFLIVISLPLILLATLIKERKDAETALRASSQRFRELADTVPAMLWMSDEQGQCLFVNQRWLAFTGRNFAEELGRGWAQAIHPEDRSRSAAAYRAAAAARTSYQCEFRIRRADGEYRWVVTQGEPRFSPQGALLGYVGSCIDITERKRAEEETQRTQKHYRELVERVQAIVWRADAATLRFSFVSQEAEAMLGFPVERWLAEPDFWAEHLHPDDRDWAVKLCRDAIARGVDYSFDYRMITADGHVVWLRDLVRVRSEAGRPTELIGVMVDMTERVKLRQELEERLRFEQLLAQLSARFVNLPGSEFEREVDHTLRLLAEFLAVDRIALIEVLADGKQLRLVHSFIASGDSPPPARILMNEHLYIAAKIRKGEVFKFARLEELPAAARAERRFYEQEGIRSHILVPLAAGGQRLGVLALSTFTTEREWPEETVQRLRFVSEILANAMLRKRAEDALCASGEALRRSHEHIQDLAGRLITAQEDEHKRIALELHDDLNQKLAALNLGISRAKRAVPTTAENALAELTALRQQAQDLTAHIRRLSHELHPAVLEHFGLCAALESYGAEFSRHEGIELKMDIEDPGGPLPAAVELCLFRVTQEALRNIAKHSGAPRAWLKMNRCDAHIQLSIADEGHGFDPDKARRKGGLGLLSMEERVRFLQGNFELCAQPGQGVRLTVRIPLPGDYQIETEDLRQGVQD